MPSRGWRRRARQCRFCHAAAGVADPIAADAVIRSARRGVAQAGSKRRFAHSHRRRRDRRADVFDRCLGNHPDAAARHTGLWPVRVVTDFGKAAFVLWPLAILLFAVAIVSPRLPGTTRTCGCASGVRISSSCFSPCWCRCCRRSHQMDRRARPAVCRRQGQCFQVHAFRRNRSLCQFSLRACHHQRRTGFRCRIAVAAARGSRWSIYAFLVAASRLVLLAHHPSDVVAGAVVGVAGAMVVRYWFAIHASGSHCAGGVIEPLSRPPRGRLKGVAPGGIAP